METSTGLLGSRWQWRRGVLLLPVGLFLAMTAAASADCVSVLTILSDQNRQRLEVPADRIASVAFEYGLSDASAAPQAGAVAERQTRGPDFMLIHTKDGKVHRVSLNGSHGATFNPSISVRCDTSPESKAPVSTGGTAGGAGTPIATGDAPAPSAPSRSTGRSQSWAFSIPSQKLNYRYNLVWMGSSFTGTYVVPANNKSVFQGRLYSSGGQTFIEYTQTSGSYRANYKLQEVVPGKFMGTLTDYTGTFQVELVELK